MAVNIIFFFLCLEGVIISLNLGAIPALLPSIAKDLGTSSFAAAKIIPFYMIPYGVGALLCAPLAKAFDIKYIKLFALLFFALFSFAAGKAQGLVLLSFSRIIAGVAAAFVIPLSLILIGELVPAQRRGKSVGIFFSLTFVASIVGVFLSGFISWRWLFFLPAGLAAFTFLLIFILFPEKLNKKEKISADYFRLFKVARVRNIFIYIFVLSLLYHASHCWFGVYFSKEFKFSQFQISSLLTFVGAAGALGQIIGGFLTDKIGRLKACAFGLFILSLALIFLAFKMPVILLTIIMIIFGLGWTINHNAVSTLLTDLPQRLRSEAASLNSALRFISGGMGASMSGVFMSKNFSLTFLSYGVVLFIFSLATTKILQENK